MDRNRNTVPLEGVLSILAKSPRVADRLKKEFGPKEGESALLMLRQARLAGDLGDSVHAFLSDEIGNNAEEVLTRYGWASDTNEPYPISVMGYEGVFFVQGAECERVGYFTAANDAESYIRSNWGDMAKDTAEEWDEQED
jgi:hypothetical protein